MDKILDPCLLAQLHSATWHRHERMEQLSFVTELVGGSLPLQSYIGQLRGLAIILLSIDNALLSLPKELAERLRPFISRRFFMLCDDLSFFAPQIIPDIMPAVKSALDAATIIRQAVPGKLLGYLYVLQGTIRGNQVHLPDIIRCFTLNDQGNGFYRGYGANPDTVWEEFCSVANCADPALIPQAIAGATEMYEIMERFHQLLYPLPEIGNGFTAAGLNPEAGDHPVPQESEILQAAIRAGRRCRDEFSYYERRYGERGRRFTDSDVAWLASLVTHDENVILDQVLWLGRLLSVRGMPMILLERQLELLHEEMGTLAKCPPLADLSGALEKLKQQRQRLAVQDQCNKVCQAVTDMLHHVEFSDLPIILIAAHLDMRNGIPECLASLVSWLVDASILTKTEIDAVCAHLADL
jgi:heme oxygenase